MDQKQIIHILRNPWGWSEETISDARQAAADEIERLQKLVDAAREECPHRYGSDGECMYCGAMEG